MSKKRVGIYIDEEVWKKVTECAWEQRKSISVYVESILMGRLRGNAKQLVEDVIIPERVTYPPYAPTLGPSDPVPPIGPTCESPVESGDRTAAGDVLGPRSDDEVIGEVKGKLSVLREKFKIDNPKKICPACGARNEKCVCK